LKRSQSAASGSDGIVTSSLLVEAGILGGPHVTTHWRYARELQQRDAVRVSACVRPAAAGDQTRGACAVTDLVDNIGNSGTTPI